MIGLKIRDLRKKKGLTQIELASGIMHRCALIRIENGLSSPNFERLMKIAKKLGVSIDYFTTENRQTEMELQISPDIQCDLLEMLNKREYELIILKYLEGNKVRFKNENGVLYSYIVGISYWNLEDYRPAKKFLLIFINRIEKSDLSSKKNYIIEYAESLKVIARINLFNKKADEVEKYLVRARKSLSDNNKKTHVMYWFISHNLASYYEDIMEYEKALDILQDIISENNVIIHKTVTLAAHQTASVIYMDLGDFYRAKDQLRKAISLCDYTGNFHQASLCKVNLIILMRTAKEYNEALEFVEATLKESNPADQIYHILLLQKTFVMFNSGNIEDIPKILKQLNYGKLRTKDRYNYLFLKGMSYFAVKDFQKSTICFNKTKSFFKENKHYLDIRYMNNLLFKMSGKKAILEESNQLSNLPFNKNFVLDPDELINININKTI